MKGRKPSTDEQEWLTAICDLGCCVCLLFHETYSPCMPHHIDGKTKPGAHFKSIGLCHNHHQGGYDDDVCVSRHTNKTSFEAKYGTEKELLEQVKGIMGVNG